MRIAIISDIHANLPALEQTLRSIDQEDIDSVYCLGDLVGYDLWPNAVISEIRKRKIPTIAGNHDAKAVQISDHRKLYVDDDEFDYNIIAKDHLPYLADLPSHIRIEFPMGSTSFTVLMVHGSPYSNREYLHFDKEESEFVRIFRDTGTDMLVFGHTHKPYHRIIRDTENDKTYHAVNAGSVGKPKDGNPDGCYAVITVNQNKPTVLSKGIKVEFIRVKYDVDKAAQAIESSPLPNTLAAMLRKAY